MAMNRRAIEQAVGQVAADARRLAAEGTGELRRLDADGRVEQDLKRAAGAASAGWAAFVRAIGQERGTT
jgi:hypothetical protein